MPNCAATKCTNTSMKKYKMCYFPRKDPERCAVWAKNMVKDRNWASTIHSALCQVHFAPEAWELHRTDGLLKLKNNAVPTLFYDPEIGPPQGPKAVVLEPQVTAPVDTRMDDAQHDADVNENEEPVSDNVEEFLAQQQPVNTDKVDHNTLSQDIAEMAKRLEKSERLRKKAERFGKQIGNKYAEAQRKIKRLEKQVGTLYQCPDAVKKLFNEDQLKLLSGECKQVSVWSNETIHKAMKLRFACGATGYEAVASEYALPSLRTLRRRLKVIKFESGILKDVFD